MVTDFIQGGVAGESEESAILVFVPILQVASQLQYLSALRIEQLQGSCVQIEMIVYVPKDVEVK